MRRRVGQNKKKAAAKRKIVTRKAAAAAAKPLNGRPQEVLDRGPVDLIGRAASAAIRTGSRS